MNSKNKDFLKIDDIIKRAKERGVDFGNAKPRSRLRYYAKLGLIPPAERKVFNGNNQSTGAYPKYVLEILEEIDEKIEKGKSIREIAKEKKEKEKEQLKEDLEKEQNKKEKSKIPSPSSIVPKHVADLLEKIDEKLGKGKQVNFGKENIEESPKEEVSYEGPAITLTPTYRKKEKVNERKKESGLKKEDFKKEKEKSHSFFFSLARFGIFILLMGVLGLMLSLGFFGEDLSANLLNGLYADNEIKSNNLKADLLSQSGGGSTAQQNVLSNFKSEPYFNINVETDVNAPLNLKGKATTSPTLSFYQNDFQGTLTTSDLTSDQTYNLPDQSGTVCLSSGNCETGGEEQITVTDGIDGRLTKFTGPNSITSASISDLYEGESILNITEEGDIGIGTENPARKLEVAGSIFASPTEGEENAVFGSESSLNIESNNNLGVHVNEEGNVGIGTTEAENEFQVEGRIQASGDICTDAGGGKCLSDLDSGSS
ncbi:MAG: hypothetical protein ACOC1P_02005, partial [Minisyncoccales bacterium]